MYAASFTGLPCNPRMLDADTDKPGHGPIKSFCVERGETTEFVFQGFLAVLELGGFWASLNLLVLASISFCFTGFLKVLPI